MGLMGVVVLKGNKWAAKKRHSLRCEEANNHQRHRPCPLYRERDTICPLIVKGDEAVKYAGGYELSNSPAKVSIAKPHHCIFAETYQQRFT